MLVRRYRSVLRVITGALLFTGLLCGGPAQAQELTDVCLKNKVAARARVEMRDQKIFLYLQGNPPALDMTDQIHSIGNPDDPLCKEPTPSHVKDQTPPSTAVQSCETTRFGIRGSNTIGERLMPSLIEGFSKSAFGTAPKVTFPKPEEGTIEISQPGCPEPVATIDYQSKGSGTAPPALKAGQTSIGMMSRRIKDEEVADLEPVLKVKLTDPESEHIVALDGLAVVVSRDNPIKTMSLDQIARIFSGEISNWKDVQGTGEKKGESVVGRDAVIKIHARDDKSGTYDTFKNVVLEREEPKRKLSPNAKRYESSEQLSGEVAKDPDAIGFIGFPYINENHALKISSSCGLTSEPETFQVKLESYPLARQLFVYTPGTPTNPIVKRLLDYSLSDEAQKIVIETGFIDQSVDFHNAASQRRLVEAVTANPQFGLEAANAVPPSAARQLAEIAKTMQRSSIVFRFARNEAALDNLASQNVGRLARYLKQPSLSGRRVLLVGFADSEGDWSPNLSLSLARANSIAQALQSQGVRVAENSQTGLSYMAPVACNDSDKGRALNRRVEVWIAK